MASVMYRVVPSQDRSGWGANALTALGLGDAPSGITPDAMRRVLANQRTLEVTLDAASEIQRWAAGIPGWPALGHKPLKFERLVENGSGFRSRWSVALWTTAEEREQIETLAQRTGESVAGLLLRLGIQLASGGEPPGLHPEGGLPIPDEVPEEVGADPEPQGPRTGGPQRRIVRPASQE